MSFRFAIRSVAVAVLAAVVAWLPMAILLTLDMDSNLAIGVATSLLVAPLAGAFLIGLPSAWLVFHAVRDDASFGVAQLILVANGFAIILAIVIAAWSGLFGLFFLGFPVFLAANAFALLGWQFVLKRYRMASHV